MQTVRLRRLQKRLGFYLELSKGPSCILKKSDCVLPMPWKYEWDWIKKKWTKLLGRESVKTTQPAGCGQLVMTTLSSAMEEKHDMKNVVFLEEKVGRGSVSKSGWRWREQSGLLVIWKTTGDYTLRAKTTRLQASPGENVKFHLKWESLNWEMWLKC